MNNHVRARTEMNVISLVLVPLLAKVSPTARGTWTQAVEQTSHCDLEGTSVWEE